MKELLYLLLILQINQTFPQYFDFSQEMPQLQQGTENLGDMISNNIQRQLQPLNNLHNTISNNIQRQLQPLNNLHNTITNNIRNQMLPLHYLGQNIRDNVHTSLLPVYAMSMKNDMKNGIGGRTIVTFGSGRTFIVENRQRYTCVGIIQRGQCSNLIPFHISSREDYCYAPSFAVVNNHICLSTSALNVESYNNNFNCRSSDGSPTLVLTKRQYQALCGQASPSNANYIYYSNPNHPSHVAIPNSNPYVTCLNNEPNVCTFIDSAPLSGLVSNQNSFYSSFNYAS